jgi:hypothetical protein
VLGCGVPPLAEVAQQSQEALEPTESQAHESVRTRTMIMMMTGAHQNSSAAGVTRYWLGMASPSLCGRLSLLLLQK